MKSLFVMMVMMITSTTFGQQIGKVAIGNSMEETIKQCKSVGYEFVGEYDNIATFFIPNNEEMYDFDIELKMYASPESKTVWFGTVKFVGENKREMKRKFLQLFRSLKEKYGSPYILSRKQITWDGANSHCFIKRKKCNIEYTVISMKAFTNTFSEF